MSVVGMDGLRKCHSAILFTALQSKIIIKLALAVYFYIQNILVHSDHQKKGSLTNDRKARKSSVLAA
ncbi:hypothetical protein [Peribacillus muralis]|uniref:hypothetical protein n=1 Tax=Peribacillus muralis TaxID=264697 RepID=UPI00366CB673